LSILRKSRKTGPESGAPPERFASFFSDWWRTAVPFAPLKNFTLGLKALFAKDRLNQELDEELQTFLDESVSEKMRAGMPSSEALHAARIEMGSRESVKQNVRSAGWESMIESIWQDLRFSVRLLVKSPGFSAVAVVSLALGIGANTAIFTLINGLMLKSLPVSEPQDLVSFGTQVGGGQVDGITPGPLDLFPYSFYQRIKSPNSLFSGVCAYSSFRPVVTFRVSGTGQTAVQGISHLVSGNFFHVLGATPLLGRVLVPSDADAPGREAVAVVSYRFWQQNLSGSPGAIGHALTINGTQFTVIGVMPANFYGVSQTDQAPDFWVPLTMQQQIMLQPSQLAPRSLYWLHFMGRRQPSVRFAQIQSWITFHLQQYMIDREGPVLSSQRRQEIRGIFIQALPGNSGISDLRARYSNSLWLLTAVVVLVLLIACANLANFLLARAASREREISTRLALGSGRARIARQLLTEALVLSVSGGALGLLAAYFGTRALIQFIAGPSVQTGLSPMPDTRVLLFTLGISLATGILFGLVPALRLSRLNAAPAAQASVRAAVSGGGRNGRLIPQLLIAAQVTISLILLVSAGLLVRTLYNLENHDFGFNRDHVLLVHFNPKFAGYKSDQLGPLYVRILDSVGRIPDVRSASVSGTPPIHGGAWNSPVFFKSALVAKKDVSTLLNRVGPRYFDTVNIPLLRGRAIDFQDTSNSLKVVVVNQTFADYFFPKGDAIGQTFTVADPSVTGLFQIVGIVRTSTYLSPREEPQRMAYLPVMQLTGDDAYAYALEVRTAGQPAAIAENIRRALVAVDPNLSVLDVKTMAEQTDLQMTSEILIARLSGFFSLLALSLACIGLYGVMSHSVMRRTGEIGIRMTLGAQTGPVLWMILKEVLLLLAIGIGCGVPLTLAVVRLFQSQLFGLASFDPLTVLASIFTIAAVVLAAAYFPARRATRIDPAVTLRFQ
jgi:predicted permease